MRALVVVAILCASARADELSTIRGQPVTEVAHTVAVSFAHGVATYTVHREFRNRGRSNDEMHLEITVPVGAVATGVRIKSRDSWDTATLIDADKADAIYRSAGGHGSDRVLLEWADADRLHLQAFPMPPGVTTIEYTLTAPARYLRGRYSLDYPRATSTCAETKPTRVFSTPTLTIDHDATVDDHAIAAGVETSLAVACHPDSILPSTMTSTIVVPESPRTLRPIRSLVLDVDLDHPVPSDLTVELRTPQGRHVTIHDRATALSRRHIVEVPPDTTAAGSWQLVIGDHVPVDTGHLDRWAISFGGARFAADDMPIAIADAELPEAMRAVTIEIAPPAMAPWDVRLGRVVTSHDAFSRLEIDVAPRLSELPVRAQLVFVVDASYSMGDAGVAAELATIRAYAHHLPDSAIEIVVYRRRAERVFGAFVPAAQLDARLGAAASSFTLGNGSALDAGARLAASALAGRAGPHRIIVMTDERVRPALSVPVGLASLSSLSRDTVVHVVVPSADLRGSLRRDDDRPLAALAHAHHGIFAFLELPHDGDDVVLPLVRPTTIDRLVAPGLAVPPTIAEGSSVRLLTQARAVPAHIVLTGQLWSDPVQRTVDVDADTSRSTAVMIIATQKSIGLSREDQMIIAEVCGAVSPVTSYVVAGSRARPPQRAEEHGVEGGVCGCDARGDISGVVGPPPPPPVRPDLAAMIDARACHATHDVELAIDTTRDEIVDVTIRGPIDSMSTCVAEAAWRVRLDNRFDRESDQFIAVVRTGS